MLDDKNKHELNNDSVDKTMDSISTFGFVITEALSILLMPKNNNA